MLEVEDVAKSYGDVVALDGISLSLRAGEILGLLGPNGAGKSTLVSVIAGLLQSDRGRVRVGGHDVALEPMAVRRMLGVAPQEVGLYAQLSVLRNLRFFGKLAGLSGGDLDERVEEVASSLELTRLYDRRANELSGGEKRRLHTAVALLPGAPLLLLDEPTAGADVHTRTKLLDLVGRLASEGTTICYATHYLHEVETLNASVAVVERGRIIARGSVAELTARADEAFIEIAMDGPVPAVLASAITGSNDSTVRIPATNPGETLSGLLGSMGDAASRIRSVEIVQPSLETAYLALTGRRFDSGGEEEEDR